MRVEALQASILDALNGEMSDLLDGTAEDATFFKDVATDLAAVMVIVAKDKLAGRDASRHDATVAHLKAQVESRIDQIQIRAVISSRDAVMRVIMSAVTAAAGMSARV